MDSQPLTILTANKMKANFNVCVVKAPSFGDNRKSILNDIAVVTGATVVS